MTELNQVYKCDVCGNIVEILNAGPGELVCCNKPMVLLEENTVDASREKHVPVVTRDQDTVTVEVGSDEHPMVEKHYIQWIDLVYDGKVDRQFLKPGEKPRAVFNAPASGVKARGYCNLHGLWSAKE